LKLREYRGLFRGNVELSSLDQVDRRYSYHKKLLKAYDEEHAGLFPGPWKVDEALCIKFCEDTKKDLSDVLNSTQNLDVKQMLRALNATIEFEGKLDKRFAYRVSYIFVVCFFSSKYILIYIIFIYLFI